MTELEITSTPRETLVWAPTMQDADQLRRELVDAGFLVLDADPWELDQHKLIPEGEHAEFDPARIFNVEIGAEANASLQALVDSSHRLVWHRWQPRPPRKVWGVAVSVQRSSASTGTGSANSAVHFGIPVRATRGLGLRMTRDTYARISKRSSLPRWSRESDPEIWDKFDQFYEDAEHRIYTDAHCEEMQTQALENFDLNMAHFASLDHDEFEAALQRAVKSQRGMVEVTDLTKWDGVAGLYIMVLDEYRQAYVGATDTSVGILKRTSSTGPGRSRSTGSSREIPRPRSSRSTASVRSTPRASSLSRPPARSPARTRCLTRSRPSSCSTASRRPRRRQARRHQRCRPGDQAPRVPGARRRDQLSRSDVSSDSSRAHGCPARSSRTTRAPGSCRPGSWGRRSPGSNTGSSPRCAHRRESLATARVRRCRR